MVISWLSIEKKMEESQEISLPKKVWKLLEDPKKSTLLYTCKGGYETCEQVGELLRKFYKNLINIFYINLV